MREKWYDVMKVTVEELGKKIGYQFKSAELLELALRHRSLGKNSNERLEFLGDSILNFVIAAELFNRYPKYREGELSRLRSNLVNRETLSILASNFNLSDYLLLGVGEKKSGGFNRGSILADAVEAIIGAIYLDSDFATCYTKVADWYADKLINLTLTGQKDAKTELQELLQSRKFPLPQYEIVNALGETHQQTFYVRCQVDGLSFISQGVGHSKQKAEQDAAKKFLEEMIK
jgi:ribonuclease III